MRYAFGNQLGDAALASLRPLLAGPLSGLVTFGLGARLTAEAAGRAGQ